MAPRRRIRMAIVAAIGLYVIITFVRTLAPSRDTTYTEHLSKKLRVEREMEKAGNWKQQGLNFHSNNVDRLPDASTVRQQLSFHFPYEPKKGFQKNIWQTWKVGVDDTTFPAKYKRFTTTWDEKNPGYKHLVITDDQCDVMINDLYSGVPDVKKAWNVMPKIILKADFFRYLILYARGGVYSDIDTTGLKPVDTWLSNNDSVYGKPNGAGLVVGIEADPDRPDWADWYARRIQFCQWTIQAKKGHPMLRELIAKITEKTLERHKKGQLNKVLGKDEGGDVMNWTGPGIWTDTVFEYINNVVQPPALPEESKPDDVITWKTFTGIEIPVILEDVMVLPITSFSPDVGQMGAQSSSHELAYVKHLFLGLWKNDD